MDVTGLEQPPDPPYREDKVELSDGRDLGFAEFGDPDGSPVVWLHGTPGARRQIPPDAPAHASAHRIRLVVPERPGVGWSSTDPSRTLQSFARDVEELLDAIGVDRFAIAGLSGGGPHVLAVAHELPDRVAAGALLGGMVPFRGPDAPPSMPELLPLAMDVVHRLRSPLSGVMTQLLKRIEPQQVDVVFPLVMKILPENDRSVIDTPGFRAMFVDDLYTASRRQFRAQIYDVSAMGQDWGFSPRDIRVPIKSWHGTGDRLVPIGHAEHLIGLIPNAELVTIEGDGHFAGYTRAPEVLTWLTGHLRTGRRRTTGATTGGRR